MVYQRRGGFILHGGPGTLAQGFRGCEEGEKVFCDFKVAVGGGVVEKAGLGAETGLVDVDGGGEECGRGGLVSGAEGGDQRGEGGEVVGASGVDEVVEFVGCRGRDGRARA